MKRTFSLGLVAAVVAVAPPTVLAQTKVGGPICTDTTWDLAGSPYIVTLGGGIVIGCDATLTIEPGVVVKFDPALGLDVGSASWGSGTLVARGTQGAEIKFTSIKDPNDPVDPAAPGDWARIYFSDYAADAEFDAQDNYLSGCILEHVIVEYAGDAGAGAISANSSRPFLNYCEVRDNDARGIRCDNIGAPGIRITNCNIHHNQGGIYLYSTDSSTVGGNTISDNSGVMYGGGIYMHYSDGNTLTGNEITGNTANNGGGGIYMYSSDGNTLSENTITGNWGGGIYNAYASDNTTVSSCTIADNYLGGGLTGGVWVGVISERFSLAGDPGAGEYNIICCNEGYEVYNDNAYYKDGRYDIDARYVLWCTDSTEQIMEGIFDHLDDVSKAYVVWYPFVTPGDFDVDGDVDLDDFGVFAACYNGAANPPAATCPPGVDADLDNDGDVDLDDFGIFAANYTGAE